MQWLKDIQTILGKEPENWLAYLQGQQLNNIQQTKHAGLSLKHRWHIFVRVVFFYLRYIAFWHCGRAPKKVSFFVFCGTENQVSSLDSTVNSLVEKGEVVIGVVNKSTINSSFRKRVYKPFSLNLADFFKSSVLLATRISALRRMVNSDYIGDKGRCVESFIKAYPYLVYFHRSLKKFNPEYVIVSNDHNVANRCLLAVAHEFGIKTVYLQHASVSSLFPALRVDYAFLDGKCAFETYKACEINQPDTGRNAPVPIIILSGQKKVLKRKLVEKNLVIGLAINALDNSSEAIRLVEQLNDCGYAVCVRWHPSQKKASKVIKEGLMNSNAFFSDPKIEAVGDFLGRINWLIAGNSSIHLEAALAGVLPFYFELTPPEKPDYYGYVKYGLAKQVESVDEIIRYISGAQQCPQPDIEAVRYFSSTYKTEWHGKEGELVADCLVRLLSGKKITVNSDKLHSVNYESHKPSRLTVI